jgi:uncharacterized FlaG/YvyC family protein
MPEGKMSYDQINSVPKIEQDRALSAPAQMQASVQVKASAQVKAAEPKKPSPQETSTASQRTPVVTSENFSLKFIVDDKSNDITVLVVNRETKEVVRTIPSQELRNYQDGDLLSLFA